MLKPEPTIEAYRKFAKLRIDAVNHALVGIPEERVRYHLCWGSWHGPHTHDLPLEHIIDLTLEVKSQTYSFEAGNVRHEHEWRVWQQAKPPPGKMLMDREIDPPQLHLAAFRGTIRARASKVILAGLRGALTPA
jgi:5-methyltetrahydropteroyltriglutamate--homocysteine methyltransferase